MSASKSNQLALILEPDPQTSIFKSLKNIKQNANGITIPEININSIRNKFDFLSKMICGNIDVLLITETKIDTSFPSVQFQIDGYTAPYHLGRNWNSGRMLLYVWDDTSSKVLHNTDFGSEIEVMFVEITIRKLSGI